MMDFFMVSTRSTKRGVIEIYPKFIIKKSEDLMIRGGDFYAIWVEERGLWSTDEQDALQLIDRELDIFVKEHRNKFDSDVRVLHLWDAESKMIDRWHKYCQRDMRDSYHQLDAKLIFANDQHKKTDYASKYLPYELKKGECPAYNRLMSVLYSEKERHKLEWAIGSIVAGDSVFIQKFVVLYGAAGTGKSTVLNIIQKLFDGYFTVFDAKALGSSTNAFALEAFRSNPLVAIQHDGDLSRIEDNTRLNSLVSHETMIVNEKFKSTYSNQFNCFLFMGTNRPVKITDAKSGLLRRLIDVSPTGDKIPQVEYSQLVSQIDFELGAIAYHCKQVYISNPNAYDAYVPTSMMSASNDFYNFVLDLYYEFEKEDGVSFNRAWEMYDDYCKTSNVSYPYQKRIFREELKNYFREYTDRVRLGNGERIRGYYSGFRTEKFDYDLDDGIDILPVWIEFDSTESRFDQEYAGCPAQYANSYETPTTKWSNVTTKLSDLDTSKLHYVQVPSNHIVIDFDILDETGNKSLDLNIAAASKWPATYAELSKSGCGVHLHYIYDGDVSKLSRVYDDHIEIKIFTGNSSLRRKVSKCCNKPFTVINSGLPLKESGKLVNFESFKNEKALRTFIKRNLNKEYHANTAPSVDFIFKGLEDAYNSGMSYDVSDMYTSILNFAMSSTNQADKCLKTVQKMHLYSEEHEAALSNDDAPIVFFDVEVFPNLFLVCWKIAGKDRPVNRMFNPSGQEIEQLVQNKLVGFNNRKYDNIMLYNCMLGKTPEELYSISRKLIGKGRVSGYYEATSLSYTDVYDFSSDKKSLKKFEIELGIHHQELGLPWNKPVDKSLWETVAEYCDNDVIATEAVFNARQGDFTARKILADLASMTVNDTTNTLTTRIIFEKDKSPQKQFNYRDLGDMSDVSTEDRFVITDDLEFLNVMDYDEFTAFNSKGQPIFPGYKFDAGKSYYRDEIVGEGGYVYSVPGMYVNVALLDIASMHPSSIIAENLFGKYTERFNDILQARIAIKHRDFARARNMLDGKLAKYLTDESTADDLAQALKIAINSVYGLTAAKFDNPFRDSRNKDNIVAKRGALFMINLKHEVERRGYLTVHIKTDSIKIANATPEIIHFVINYGSLYGYTFEHEATYERMCLVNKADYVARYASLEECYDLYGEEYVNRQNDILKDNKKHPHEWTATGKQFQIPYVFKKLFTNEEIIFEDTCEIKEVKANSGDAGLYLRDPDDKNAEMHFIGRTGLFCPIKKECGGMELLRVAVDDSGNQKIGAVADTKGYYWLEAETVKTLGKESDIDISYYNSLVDEAIETINTYGDSEWFRFGEMPDTTKEDELFNKR